MLCLASSERLYLVRDELCTPKLSSNLETYLDVCDRSTIFKLSLSLLYCALHHFILFISFICLDLFVCSHTCVQPREIHIAPQLLLEEFRGDSPEPFTGNSATLFGYTKCVALVFKFRIICHRLALHLFTPL